jgi:undecaprenyl diphosphate synthase
MHTSPAIRERASRDPLPRHVAIMLDGNGRWAEQRGLPRARGHERGADAVRAAVRGSRVRGIATLTLYAFSVANWSRPKEEVDALMQLCTEFCRREQEDLVAQDIRVRVIGDLDEVPTATRHAVEDLIEATSGGRGMTLALALSYGGRQDVLNAMKQIAIQARAGLLIPEEISESSVRRFLTTGDLPDPDLVIRTGGEQRLSDFLLFESAYAELFFTETLWPDFTEETLAEALDAYARRERRFGRTGAQAQMLAVGE